MCPALDSNAMLKLSHHRVHKKYERSLVADCEYVLFSSFSDSAIVSQMHTPVCSPAFSQTKSRSSFVWQSPCKHIVMLHSWRTPALHDISTKRRKLDSTLGCCLCQLWRNLGILVHAQELLASHLKDRQASEHAMQVHSGRTESHCSTAQDNQRALDSNTMHYMRF